MLIRLDIARYAMVTLAVVSSLQAVGNVLVLALLVRPAVPMMVLAAALGAAGGVTGLYLSYGFGLPAGSMIVLVLTTIFVACALGAPRHGRFARRRSPTRGRVAI